jgi:hypothetical protein
LNITPSNAGTKQLGKIAGLARALSILLSVVYAFVAIPGVDNGLVLVVLGLIAGLSAVWHGQGRSVRSGQIS